MTVEHRSTEREPGTWHDNAPGVPVPRAIALDAWLRAAYEVLKDVAGVYGGTITYGKLRDRIFQLTGYRTKQLPQNFLPTLLGPIQRETAQDGLPPLTSLVVRASDGRVGPGYITHTRLSGIDDDHEREVAAAQDRLACYRRFALDVPTDAVPQLTARYRAVRERAECKAPRERPAAQACPTCGYTLPATGVCDDCN